MITLTLGWQLQCTSDMTCCIRLCDSAKRPRDDENVFHGSWNVEPGVEFIIASIFENRSTPRTASSLSSKSSVDRSRQERKGERTDRVRQWAWTEMYMPHPFRLQVKQRHSRLDQIKIARRGGSIIFASDDLDVLGIHRLWSRRKVTSMYMSLAHLTPEIPFNNTENIGQGNMDKTTRNRSNGELINYLYNFSRDSCK